MLDQALIASFGKRTPSLSSEPLWPLPGFGGRVPSVLEDLDTSPGIAVALARRSRGDLLDRFPINTSNGSAGHFMPDKWPAIAVWDGVIIHAKPVHLGYGFSIVVDHQNGWATYYGNLETIFATRTDRRILRRPEIVKRGHALGLVGSPDPHALKSLYFELWRLRAHEDVLDRVDPRPYLSSWVVPSRDEPTLAVGERPRAVPDVGDQAFTAAIG